MRYVGREFSDVVRGIELKCPIHYCPVKVDK